MRIIGLIDTDITILQMKAGEIGVITQSSDDEVPIGVVVQRFGNYILLLQSPIFISITKNNDFRVRILQKGETLIIE